MHPVHGLTIIALFCVPCGTAVAQDVPRETAASFLPASEVTTAVFVEIEQDPAFDEFNAQLGAAIDANREWYAQYAREHAADGGARPPWDERLGVSRADYEHFAEPMNHYREIARQPITLRTRRSGSAVQVELVGEGLLLPSLALDADAQTARAQCDVLPLRSFIDLERASLPPGVHRGVLFRTPEDQFRETNVRESLLVGEVRALGLGIIHYERWDEDGRSRVYVTFPR